MKETEMLERVRKLLDKAADSACTAEEAESFFAKANELMIKHSIDEAMLASTGKATTETPEILRIALEDPFAVCKRTLLAAIARANGCKSVRTGYSDMEQLSIVGFPSVLRSVETLYTALSLHALNEAYEMESAKATIKQIDEVVKQLGLGHAPETVARIKRQILMNDEGLKERRYSFLMGYAERVGERLREVVSAATRDASAEHGASTALVLRSREGELNRYYHEAFPRLTTGRAVSQGRSQMARQAGRSAANRADLGQKGVGGGTRRAIGR